MALASAQRDSVDAPPGTPATAGMAAYRTRTSTLSPLAAWTNEELLVESILGVDRASAYRLFSIE